jgi:hypothetical protein
MIYGEHEKKFTFYKVNDGVYTKMAENPDVGFKTGFWY